jgi:hypothetical protein
MARGPQRRSGRPVLTGTAGPGHEGLREKP